MIIRYFLLQSRVIDKSIHRCFFIPDSSLSNYTVLNREESFLRNFQIQFTHDENIPFSLDQSKFDLRTSDRRFSIRIKSIPRNHCHLHRYPMFFNCKTTIRDTCPDLSFICRSLCHLYFAGKTNSV